MKSIFYKYLIFTFSLALVFSGCKKDHNNNNITVEEKPTPYKLKYAPYFPEPIIMPENPLTEEGVKLGRMLFHDKILSSNGRACVTCHHQDKSFIFSNKILGLNKDIYANIPPLINLAWNPDFGWIGSEHKLDLVPATDFGPLFFNSNMDTVLARVKRHAQYPALFKKAFGVKELTIATLEEKTSYAIAQYLRTIIADESKFDLYLGAKAKLTDAEERGMMIFFSEKGDCFHCHGGPLLTDNKFHNIGLDNVFEGSNLGLFTVTGKEYDKGKFSAPTLRNIALTAPYMHDGRFETLEDVIQHYNKGVKKSATLDPIMTKPGKETGLNLTSQEVQDLISFLQTFTDHTILTNPDFSNPL
ncbi:MAG: cytochrome-c peroxidase [Bacteroidia bacterium]